MFNLSLSSKWDLYWFQAKENLAAETEVEDLVTWTWNQELDSSIAEVAGWGNQAEV
jgi:hypothetical protein